MLFAVAELQQALRGPPSLVFGRARLQAHPRWAQGVDPQRALIESPLKLLPGGIL